MLLKYVNAMKYLEIIPDFLSMYGVFTSQSTSQIRQEMSNGNHLSLYYEVGILFPIQHIFIILKCLIMY